MTQGKAVACLAGGVLAFVAGLGVSLLFEGHWILAGIVHSALYCAAGAALGYKWPADGWRLGVWLGLCWLGFIPFNYLLAGDVMDWSGPGIVQQAKGVLEFSMPFFAGCFGAAAGALASERRSVKA